MYSMSWLDGSQVNLPVAFAAGVVTFFASCLLPLVPTYLAYLSGVSLSQAQISAPERWRVVKAAILFTLGFVISFVMIGLALQVVAAPFWGYKWWIEKVAGVLFIFLGALLKKLWGKCLAYLHLSTPQSALRDCFMS